LTGRPPFEGATDWAILRAQIEEPPRPPSEKVPQVPRWIDQAVLKALAKAPADRFQTVEEMRRTLLRQGETLPGQVVPPPPPPVSIHELPTQAAPVQRAQTPPPLPAIPPAAAPLPVQTSYQPVPLPPRKGAAGKVIAAAALAVALLGAAGFAVWLFSDTTSSEAPGDPQAQVSPEPTANPANPPAQQAADPEAGTAPSGEDTRPAPVPVPSRQEPPSEPEAEEEPAAPEPEESSTPGTATYVPPTDEPEPAAEPPLEELRRLATDLQTRSTEILDTYQAFLDAKEEAGEELTDDDETLQEHLEELADAADHFHKAVEGGGFFGRVRRRPAGANLLKVQQRSRELAQKGKEVDALMAKVQPGGDVRQAWKAIRHDWQRALDVATELR
ncbi:MAG TPA: hypothetical protein DD490_23340, partial [Acidobacteria bacterium]|nr:hypothetical protein [Acidobacteriota bacterium]